MDKQEAIKILKNFHDKSALFSVRTALETVLPELKEDENELEWLKQFIQEEAYILSMDIRDDEDSFRLKKLQKSLEWLKKQGKTITVDIDKMVDEFAHTEVKDYGTPSMIEVDAYRKGINDTLRLSLKLEKQGEKSINQYDIEIPFGAKDSVLIEESYYIPKGYHAEISKDKVTIKKGEQKLAWSAEDMFKVQRICKYLCEAKKYYADITEVRDCIDWLKSLKQRIGG